MINLRSEKELEKIRKTASLAVHTMEMLRDTIKPGLTTGEISDKSKEFIEKRGGKAAFLGYQGYPGAICISINDEVVHGIPGKRVLNEGDLVKLDIGTYVDGFYGDMARTYPVGKVSAEAADLIEKTEESLYKGIQKALVGNRIGDIGYAIQSYVEQYNYGVVRDLVGHGVGRHLHEDPQIPNFGKPGEGPVMRKGMILAIEPMINAGTWKVKVLEDDWTVITADGKLSAHFENMCAVTDSHPEILTLLSGEERWLKMIQ